MLVAVLCLATSVFAGMSDVGPVRWNLHGSGESRSWQASAIPVAGPYSVKFRAAIVKGNGGTFSIQVDGVELTCGGTGFRIAGQAERGEFGQMRDRRYHEFVFVVAGDRMRWFFDGDECPPVSVAGGEREFSLSAKGADVEFEIPKIVSKDVTRSPKWPYRNQVINGGFECLANGYPVSWSTQGFGFEDIIDYVDLERSRARFRVDDSVAYEGRNSMFVERRKGESSIQLCECWRKRLPETDYVLSGYIRSDLPGTEVTVAALQHYSSISRQTLRPSAEWRRFELPFRTTSGESSRVEFAVSSDEGRFWVDAVQVENGANASEFVTRPYSEPKLPVDAPKVTDHYYSEESNPVAEDPAAVPRLPRIDPWRNSYRFGEDEYFPFGFTTSSAYKGLDLYCKALDAYKSYGFNYLKITQNGFPEDSAELRRMLDAAEERGIKTAFYVNHDSKTYEVDRRKLAMLRDVRDHPNLLEVAVLDETFEGPGQERRKREADFIRSEIGVPVGFNEYDAGVVTHLDLSAADVVSVDMYPVGNTEIASYWYLLHELKDNNPGRIVIYYAQAAGHFTGLWPRDPTPEEVVAQAYIGFSLELFGVRWWQACPLTEPVLPTMARVKRERDEINPSRFLDGARCDVSCASWNDSVKFTARTDGQILTIISVNIASRPVAAKWTLPTKSSAADVLFEDRTFRIDGKAFEDSYGPHERHVYRIRLEQAKMKSVGLGTALSSVRVPGAFHRPEVRAHVGIPSIAVSPRNGRMWATWYNGEHRGEDYYNYVSLVTSSDGGKSWKEVLVADPDEAGPKRSFDPELWIAPDGKLRWTWTERMCNPAKGDPAVDYGLDIGDEKTDVVKMATLSAENEPVLPLDVAEIGRGVMMCKPIVLRNGDWLMPLAHWYGEPSACFYASTDGGRTFVYRGGVTLPKECRRFDEHQAVERGNGDVVVFIRSDWDHDGMTFHPWMSVSRDCGRTWDRPVRASYHHTSSRVFVRRLESGNWLLVKHGPIDQNVDRKELTAYLSRDEGRTWIGGLMLDEREGVSYPDGQQLPDGTIVVIYDYNRLKDKAIHYAKFTESDVVAGKDVSGGVCLRNVITADNVLR